MKGVTLILSILILLLSLKPCSDGNNAEDQIADEISVNHDHGQDNDDTCPVTCICICCGMSITYELLDPFTLQLNTEISTLVFSEYASDYRFDFLANIWQPPQLIG